jgi:methionyl-tRNA formyltransferase
MLCDMKILMIGSVEEGWKIFNEVLKCPEHNIDVVAIITLDEEKDTSLISGYRSFEDLASSYNKPLYKIKHIRTAESYALIKSLGPDLIMVMGWSQLVSDDVLEIPKYGCIGLHTTLLPRHRGRAPIPWAIIKGLGKSGNTLFYFTPGVDNGDIIAQAHFYITLKDTAASIYAKATRAGIDLVIQNLPLIKSGSAPRIAQDESISDHWPKRKPKDGLINWNSSSMELYNLIRGVSHPYPGAYTFYEDKKLFFWAADLVSEEELEFDIIIPGKILDEARYEEGFIVGTNDGVILITSVQMEGEEEISGFEFLKRNNIIIGFVFSEKKI